MSDFPAKVDGIGEAERLERARHADMIWLGPGGIGATNNIPRYIKQHCEPFQLRAAHRLQVQRPSIQDGKLAEKGIFINIINYFSDQELYFLGQIRRIRKY